jgi:hypothetical protein
MVSRRRRRFPVGFLCGLGLGLGIGIGLGLGIGIELGLGLLHPRSRRGPRLPLAAPSGPERSYYDDDAAAVGGVGTGWPS